MFNSSRFSWLHFTDLHVGVTGSNYLWPDVVDEILIDLEKLHKQSGPWDAIFFTGDLTQKGTESEFQQLTQTLNHIREHIAALGSDPIFLAVPGNHDLVRPDSQIKTSVDHLGANWATDPDLRNIFWTKPESQVREVVREAFTNWQTWSETGIDWERCTDVRKGGLLPGDFAATIETGNIRIGILGLNTAALQLKGGNYFGRLSLDAKQLEPLFPKGINSWAKDHDACILLTHHPSDWLDREGRNALNTPIWPPGRFALHLCGHQHEPYDLTQSVGGAQPKTILIGRSLFGMEYWGEQETRLHGYSVGVIEFNDRRQLRIWPRSGYLQQGGSWRLDKDISVSTEADEGMAARDLNASPRAKLAKKLVFQPKLTGWFEVTKAFLAEKKRTLSDEELALFFNGQEPSWEHAMAEPDQLPRRRVVREVVEVLQTRGIPLLVRLIGAGGEGKSMALRQIAASLSLSGKRVFYREDEGKTLIEELLKLPDNEMYFLISDDAEQIAAEAFIVIKTLQGKSKRNICWILAARDTDWKASFQYRVEPPWSPYIEEWPESIRRNRLFPMDKAEAQDVVNAWERANCLGELESFSVAERADYLWSAASMKGKLSDATFFGGILETRFRAEGLRDHVGRLMRRLREKNNRIGSKGGTLFDAFLYAAAADAVGIPGIDLNVIADLLGVDRRDRRTKILTPLGLEAVGTGSGTALRTRHPAIAKAAIIIAEEELEEDLEEVYKDIVRGTAETRVEIPVTPFAEVLHCAPILLTTLPELGIPFDRAKGIAIAVADEAERAGEDSDFLVFTVTRAKTYREAGDNIGATQILRLAIPTALARRDWSSMGRSYINELAVCEGKIGNPLISFWLGGLSVLDIKTVDSISRERAKISLASMGSVCNKHTVLYGEELYAKTLRAVVMLGMPIAPDNRTQRNFQQYKKRADELGIVTCDFNTAFEWLEDAMRITFERITDSEILKLTERLGITYPKQISFQKLRSLLGN